MIDIEKNRGEYTLLAYLVCEAASAREIISRAMVGADAFTDGACRAAFLALMQEPSTDETTRLGIAKREIPALAADADLEAFLGLATNPGALNYEVIHFAEAAIKRESHADIQQLFLQSGGQPPAFVFESIQKQTEIALTKIAALHAAFDAADNGNAFAASAVLDESLLHVPGFIDELTDYSMLTAQRPNRTLSFAGALAMLAHLAGRRFVGPNDTYPNIYLIALADSSVGKDWPRKLNRNVALKMRVPQTVQNSIGSGQSIEDALLRSPALLLQLDEFDTLLNVMKDEKSNKQATEAIWSALLTIFTNSSTYFSTRLKAMTAKGGGGGEVVHNPSLSIFATAIPSNFYGALCKRALDSGLLARCLVLEADQRSRTNHNAGMSTHPFPNSFLHRLRELEINDRRFSDKGEVDPRDIINVPFADGAADEMARVSDEADDLYEEAVRTRNELAKPIWGRSAELVSKFALLYAISENVGDSNNYAISREAVLWAWKFTKPLQLRMLDMVHERTSVSPMDALVQKALRAIKKAGKKGISRSDLATAKHFMSSEMDKIEETLLDQNQIVVERLPVVGNGKAAKLYIAVTNKSRKGA